jgi:hypothetical protein
MVAIVVATSCEPVSNSHSGQIIVSSAFNFEDALVYGYNFELGRNTSFPSTGEELPDILVQQFRLLDGTVKPGFFSPDNTAGFVMAGEFGNFNESINFFNDLDAADPEAQYSPATDTVFEYQVYVLKTSLDRYVKIHVSEILNVDDAAGKHIEVKIDYHYQPDGTIQFEK